VKAGMEAAQAGEKRFYQVAGFILAGGASTRMGQDKALLEVGGEPMLVRTARLLEPLVSRRAGVTVIADPKRYAKLGLRFERDDIPGQGPLGGIVTALRLSPCPWSLIVSCDLPFLTGEWLEYLMGRAVGSAAEAVVPESPQGPEPLCAAYHKRCEESFRTCLARGVRKVTEAFVGRDVEVISADEWAPFDREGRLLRNMNAPEDLAEAQAKLARRAAGT